MYFPNFSSEAKIWIYQSDKLIDANLRIVLNEKLNRFVEDWSAHGTKLKAQGKIIDEYRLVLCTDGNVEASGCSIDASVRFVKELGEKYHLNFFNRLQVLVENEGKKQLIHFSDLQEKPNLRIYQPAPRNLGEFREKETILVSDYLS